MQRGKQPHRGATWMRHHASGRAWGRARRALGGTLLCASLPGATLATGCTLIFGAPDDAPRLTFKDAGVSDGGAHDAGVDDGGAAPDAALADGGPEDAAVGEGGPLGPVDAGPVELRIALSDGAAAGEPIALPGDLGLPIHYQGRAPSTYTLTLTNEGQAPVQVQALRWQGASFPGDVAAFTAASPLGPFAIPAGGEAELRISFEPVGERPHEATLILDTTQGPLELILRVPVGRALALLGGTGGRRLVVDLEPPFEAGISVRAVEAPATDWAALLVPPASDAGAGDAGAGDAGAGDAGAGDAGAGDAEAPADLAVDTPLGVSFGGGRFYAYGAADPALGSRARLLHSTDGVTWEQCIARRAEDPAALRDTLDEVASGCSLPDGTGPLTGLAVGQDLTLAISAGRVLASSDGLHFTQVSGPVFAGSAGEAPPAHEGIVFGQGMFLVHSRERSAVTVAGAAYQHDAPHPFAIARAAFGAGAFVLVGEREGRTRSIDGGATWTDTQQGVETRPAFTDVTYTGAEFVALNPYYTWRSVDGAAWEFRPNQGRPIGACPVAGGGEVLFVERTLGSLEPTTQVVLYRSTEPLGPVPGQSAPFYDAVQPGEVGFRPACGARVFTRGE